MSPVRVTGRVRAGRRLRPPFLHGSVKEKTIYHIPKHRKEERYGYTLPI